jgi:hypothetical protein
MQAGWPATCTGKQRRRAVNRALAGVTSATGAILRAATSSSTTPATAGVVTPVPSKVNRVGLAEDRRSLF